jgi:hypothetical protein
MARKSKRKFHIEGEEEHQVGRENIRRTSCRRKKLFASTRRTVFLLLIRYLLFIFGCKYMIYHFITSFYDSKWLGGCGGVVRSERRKTTRGNNTAKYLRQPNFAVSTLADSSSVKCVFSSCSAVVVLVINSEGNVLVLRNDRLINFYGY